MDNAAACDVCARSLRAYARRIEEILRLFPLNWTDGTPANRTVIKEAYGQLKTQMQEDYKRKVPKNTPSAEAKSHEHHFYRPLAKALGRLHSPTTAVPGDALFSELASAQEDIEIHLSRLSGPRLTI